MTIPFQIDPAPRMVTQITVLAFKKNSPVSTLIRPDCFVEKLTVWTREREPFKREAFLLLPQLTYSGTNHIKQESLWNGVCWQYIRTQYIPRAMQYSCMCWYGMCIYVRRYSTVYQYILRVCMQLSSTYSKYIIVLFKQWYVLFCQLQCVIEPLTNKKGSRCI